MMDAEDHVTPSPYVTTPADDQERAAASSSAGIDITI